MKKIENYEDYLSLSFEELNSIDIDLYSEEEISKIIQYGNEFKKELSKYSSNIINEQDNNFSSLNECLNYFKGQK